MLKKAQSTHRGHKTQIKNRVRVCLCVACLQVPGVEVWFQRATDVVRKLVSGDIDIGVVGYDMLREIGNEDPDLVVIHDALGFGGCHLAVAVPNTWAATSMREARRRRRKCEQP